MSPVHLLSSVADATPIILLLNLNSFQTCCGSLDYKFWSDQLLVFCFTIFVSSYSNSYELVTVIAIVIY
ncbi:unnamed protein product [Hymenolepis diminuta]|uniref:Uncharacterized protein n=1 Tax=Hymenolepis diminuta TaxID=6216 RepID=A0A564Y3B3_HYMDI|nr:unnamed protein product [Hymenolepis diminuta]